MIGEAVLGAPVQIAYAVPDAVDAAKHWAQRFGAGPFFVRAHIELRTVVYRGRPSSFDHTSAYGQWGAIMVELVEDHGPDPNVISELVPPGASRLHHLAWLVDEGDGPGGLAATVESLAAQGMTEAMSAETSGGLPFRFVDAVDRLGHFVELYPAAPRLVAFYRQVADAAVGWDGSNPVRLLG